MGLVSVKPAVIPLRSFGLRSFGLRSFGWRSFDSRQDYRRPVSSRRRGVRRLLLQTLEPRDLLAVEVGISTRFFSPAPTVLPVFEPAAAIALTSPAMGAHDHESDHESEDRLPESSDPWQSLLVSESPLTNDDTFRLHSRPGSNHTIYLDFDGGITEGTGWNNSTGVETLVDIAYDRDGNPSSFSNSELSEIRKIWMLVAEDFAPFDVNVTTEDPGLDALTKSGGSDTTWGIRSLHTSNTNGVCSGCGGIAYVGSLPPGSAHPHLPSSPLPYSAHPHHSN